MARLRRGHRRLLTVGIVLVAAFAITMTWRANPTNYRESLTAMVTRDPKGTSPLVHAIDGYRTWLADRSGSTQVLIFESLLSLSINGGLLIHDFRSGESETQIPIAGWNLGTIGVIARCAFVILAGFKLWITAALLTVLLKWLLLRPYSGNDILGQTGNGRPFFSGMQVPIELTEVAGSPSLHVRGLACLPKGSTKSASSRNLLRCLDQFEASNATNRELVAVLAGAPTIPKQPVELADYAEVLLASSLLAHRDMSAPESGEFKADQSNFVPDKLNTEIASVFRRVITPDLRPHLAGVAPGEIATLVLSVQAGKILASTQTENGWIQNSSYPNLSARAVLHSLENYPTDYSANQRQRLRQALVFAIRQTDFGQVCLPAGFSPDFQALRSWSELCLASPNELDQKANAVESTNWQNLIHQRFQESLGGLMDSPQGSDALAACCCGNVVLIPQSRIVNVFSASINPTDLRRMVELAQVIDPDIKDVPGTAPDSPHATWRVIHRALSQHGWLCQKVGTSSVPTGGVVTVVVEPEANGLEGTPGKLIVLKDVVPIRASLVTRSLGDEWRRRVACVRGLSVITSESELQEVLSGNRPLDVRWLDVQSREVSMAG